MLLIKERCSYTFILLWLTTRLYITNFRLLLKTLLSFTVIKTFYTYGINKLEYQWISLINNSKLRLDRLLVLVSNTRNEFKSQHVPSLVQTSKKKKKKIRQRTMERYTFTYFLWLERSKTRTFTRSLRVYVIK